MRFQLTAQLPLLAALSAPFVSAFKDTSPFFLISASKHFSQADNTKPLLETSAFVQTAKGIISYCDADAYILVTQPGLHASDFAHASSAPRLSTVFKEVGVERAQAVSKVYEYDVKFEDIADILQDFAIATCDAEVEEVDAKTGNFGGFDDMKPKLIRVDFETLPENGPARHKAIMENDSFLYSIISLLPTYKYNLIYTSTPISMTPAAMKESKGDAHELRRRENFQVRDDDEKTNTTLPEGSLFKRYQFFTPAIFAGYLALFFLLSVLYVAFTALSSLQVSYGAFEKEMGPSAAKKQQQQ
ncbi:uncharacterized protein LAJ45_08564 [Morchella importuna]|uniref:Protein BIG1 n=1 Tax=Morchella conica CCBAS932 TaxID=1392247 RepID=A0A3N4KKV7_9PEZI|nr:uncharacterized protein LAJ45_08564 [Morchella importuna]KAH8147408.1 hypothetical protein LAJ45_08564 [Morchella importuna]RPB11203.1 BIG1-domain-containing protein [Morchella conica CCBAS932]